VVIEQRAQELSAAEADLAEARERHAAEETMAFYDELAGDEVCVIAASRSYPAFF
jgi:hypothetical protein